MSLGSAILVEAVFSRPGVGSMIMKAILARDYQLVQAGVLVLALSVVAMNTLIDFAYLADRSAAARRMSNWRPLRRRTAGLHHGAPCC